MPPLPWASVVALCVLRHASLSPAAASAAAPPAFAVSPNSSACHQLDHEGGKVPWGMPSVGELKYLGVVDSIHACNDAAAAWKNASAPLERCLSTCWYHSPWNVSYERQCYCNVEPTWMPLPSPQADSAVVSWPCAGPGDCSYNGHCTESNPPRCECDPAWGGVRCGELQLLPVNSKTPGYREVSTAGENVSTWGSPILFDKASGKWHGWASEMMHGCAPPHFRGIRKLPLNDCRSLVSDAASTPGKPTRKSSTSPPTSPQGHSRERASSRRPLPTSLM